MNGKTEKEALSSMAAWCSGSEHCRSEVYEKLKRQEFSPAAIERILNTLEKERYIDEERYCRSFVNDKFRFNKWGKVKIAQALYQKRVSSSVSQCCLNEIDEEEYLHILQKLIESKKKSIRAGSDYEFEQKLIRFALGRGFEIKDIERFL